MTNAAKERIREASAATRRNLPELRKLARQRGAGPSAGHSAILASVAKNREALRILARE